MGRKKKKNPSSKCKDECKKKEMNKIVVKSEVYHINEDLIMEILLRLPPTSVLRFKQVCKTWYSLISNPDFLRTHHSSSLQFYKNSNDEELMLSTYLRKGTRIKHQIKKHPLLKQAVFPSELLDCFPVKSCNGLLLFRCFGSRKDYEDTYYVCNPITQQYFKIPNIRRGETLKVYFERQLNTSCILFDPSTSLWYKLFRCLWGIDENGDILSEFYVYSSEKGSWRFLTSIPSQRIYIRDPAVLLNGISYWKVYRKVYDHDHILCFDLNKERLWFLPLPPKPVGYSERECFYFGECDGRLRLIEKHFVSRTGMHQLTFPCSFDIMEAEPQQQQQDSNLTWSVKYHVNIKVGFDHPFKYHRSTFRIIQLYKTKNNGEEEEALLLNIDGEIIIPFNLKSNNYGKALKGLKFKHCGIPGGLFDFSLMFSHITTLFPLL